MAKNYKGSLSLDWFNKQKSILVQDAATEKKGDDVPAPKLNWINKDDALFFEIAADQGKGLTPFWVSRNDIRVKEARPLVFQKGFRAEEHLKKGSLIEKEFVLIEEEYDDQSLQNILVQGDNLLALNSFKKMFDSMEEDERVKCIYIDPPYNTDKSFVHYEDNLAYSEWLTLIRDRIVVLRDLLREDGLILVSIDDQNFPHLKLILDETFGRDNFLANFIWKTAGNFDNQARIKISHEYILLYAKNEELFPIPSVIDPNIPEASKLYKDTIRNTIVKNGPKNPKSDITLPVGFPATFKEGIIPSRANKYPTYIEDVVVKDLKVTKSVKANSGWSSKALIEKYIDGGLKPIKDGKGQKTEFVLTDTGAIEAIKERDRSLGYVVSVLENMGNTQSMSADLRSNHQIEFDYPKPEKLMKYLLEICTNEGDLVLDCFGGSGTTFAVAQKIKRRWIGVEIGNQAETHIIPRLKNVLLGKDKGGISPTTKWNGGGSFKYYKLGESIIDPITRDFNWKLGRQFIETSLLTSYDFVPNDSFELKQKYLEGDASLKPVVGFHSVGSKTLAGIVSLAEPSSEESLMSYDEIMNLYNSLKEFDGIYAITIFTNRGIELASESKPDDLEIIKVPQAIFADLEK